MAVTGRRKVKVTKAGTVLTAAVEDRMADEAEAGFNPATFTPVHAASMSTPVFAGMVREFGEPDLNPYEDEDINFADELAEKYRPVFSMRECLPAWVQDTGIYLMNSASLELFRSTMSGDKEASNGQ